MNRCLISVLCLWLTCAVARAQDPDAVAASQKLAVAQYPDLAVPGTPMNAKFIAAYAAMKRVSSPQLRGDHWPEEVAKQCAKELGLAARKTSPAPGAVAAEAPVVATSAKPSRLEESAERVGSRQIVGRVLSVDLEGGAILVSPTKPRDGLAVVIDYPDIRSVAQDDRVDLTAKECGVYHYTSIIGGANSVRAYRYGRGRVWQDRQ